MAYCKIFLPDGVTELANIKSVTFREAVNSGVDLRPGCVGSASIEVEVYNTQPNAVSAGDALTYYQIDKNNTQTLIGVFYAEPVIATKNSYKFVAYDAANKLNADFSAWLRANQSNFPMSIYSLVSAACTVAGVTLGNSSWTLSTQNVQAFYADSLTCRDILSYAAELGGYFMHCHSNGRIYFDTYASPGQRQIYPSSGTSGVIKRYAYKQDGLQYANYTTAAIDGVAIHPSGEDDVAYIYPSGASGNLIHIRNNLLLTGADAAFYNAAAQYVFSRLSAIGSYRPATAKLFPKENPFRAGNIVNVTDAQGVSFTTVIMEQTVSESEAVLSSTGNEYYSDADGNTQKSLTQLASDVVRINKLKVDWADINTAIINYLTANDVTAQNLTIVDANDNVLATFNANGITLGQTDEAHAELDFNSFILKDKDGNIYFSVGDDRDINGEASVVLNYTGDGSTTEFPLAPTVAPQSKLSTISVSINGSAVSNYTSAADKITFASAPSDGDSIEITYTTNNALYHYEIGKRENASNIGAWSVSCGVDSVASAPYSAVGGGQNNKAVGRHSSVMGGRANKAEGEYSIVGGGLSNEAREKHSCVFGGTVNIAYKGSEASFIGGGLNNGTWGKYSSVVGGNLNQTGRSVAPTEGECASVLGGRQNIARGKYSSVVGGYKNEAIGEASSVLGKGCKSYRRSVLVFGEYNKTDTTGSDSSTRGNYVEIVGNGTSDSVNDRSNARTLDWDGNEALAGKLTMGATPSNEMDAAPFTMACRKNLLDNWYFVGGGSQGGWGKFPINQRGQASYTSLGSYGIDRWKVNTATGCTLSSGYASFEAISQVLPNASDLVGKTLTASVLLSSGALYSGTVTLTTLSSNTVFYTGNNVTIRYSSYWNGIQVFCNTSGSTISVVAVKLELGSSQTLAHLEGSTWVLNEVPKFEDDLEVCRCYFRMFRDQSRRPTYGIDFSPAMAKDQPTLSTMVIGGVTYYTASADL